MQEPLDPLDPPGQLGRRLRERALLSARVEGDRLAVPDEVMLAALRGERALTPDERAALVGSPLTLRRLRALSAQARRPANDPQWMGSAGLLRAAASMDALHTLGTDDGYWTLDFSRRSHGWRVILQLDPGAPFAAQLLASGLPLRVSDGGGAVVMEGVLDEDGECETDWPFSAEPCEHFLHAGGMFAVALVPD